jgi:hypothetical protein
LAGRSASLLRAFQLIEALQQFLDGWFLPRLRLSRLCDGRLAPSAARPRLGLRELVTDEARQRQTEKKPSAAVHG